MSEPFFAFAHVPRTGGQSIRAALGLTMREIHLTSVELRRRLPDCRVFTFVRDPFERAVSIYAFLHRQGRITPAGFRAWVAGGMLHPCGRPATLYEGTDYAIDVTAPQIEFMHDAEWVGRFEHIDEHFAALCNLLDVGPSPVLRVNSGVDRPHYTEFYDDETLSLITERYQEDIEWFEYQIPTTASGG